MLRVPERRIGVTVVPPVGPGIAVNMIPGTQQLRVTARIEKAFGAPGRADLRITNLGPLERDIAAGIIRRASELDPLAFASLGTTAAAGIPIPAAVLAGALGGGAGQEAAILASGGGLVTVAAGYDVPAVIFRGSSDYADSLRVGVEWTTEIRASDGALGESLGLASATFPIGTPFAAVVDYCRTTLGLGVGTPVPPVAIASTALLKPLTLLGQTRQVFEQTLDLLDVDWWVEDGALYLLDRGLALPLPPARFADLVTPGASQLLDRPQPLAEGQIGILARFTPGLTLGQPVTLETLRHPGAYRCVALAHTLDNRGGAFTTSATLEPLGLAL